MFASGRLSELDKQRKYVINMYSGGAPCPICGKIQTPWEASGQDAESWVTGGSERVYRCLECKNVLRHDVYFVSGWGWGNPNAPEPHR